MGESPSPFARLARPHPATWISILVWLPDRQLALLNGTPQNTSDSIQATWRAGPFGKPQGDPLPLPTPSGRPSSLVDRSLLGVGVKRHHHEVRNVTRGRAVVVGIESGRS
jgi:hypothetical protein